MHVILTLHLAEINQLEFNWHWEFNPKKYAMFFFESLIDQDYIASLFFSLNRIQPAARNRQA